MLGYTIRYTYTLLGYDSTVRHMPASIESDCGARAWAKLEDESLKRLGWQNIEVGNIRRVVSRPVKKEIT